MPLQQQLLTTNSQKLFKAHRELWPLIMKLMLWAEKKTVSFATAHWKPLAVKLTSCLLINSVSFVINRIMGLPNVTVAIEKNRFLIERDYLNPCKYGHLESGGHFLFVRQFRENAKSGYSDRSNFSKRNWGHSKLSVPKFIKLINKGLMFRFETATLPTLFCQRLVRGR